MILFIPAGSKPFSIAGIKGEPSLKFMQKRVGGYIEVIHLNSSQQLIVKDDRGPRDQVNPAASRSYRGYLNTRFGGNHQDTITGNALILSGEHLMR